MFFFLHWSQLKLIETRFFFLYAIEASWTELIEWIENDFLDALLEATWTYLKIE